MIDNLPAALATICITYSFAVAAVGWVLSAIARWVHNAG